jgi:hypothetical protein
MKTSSAAVACAALAFAAPAMAQGLIPTVIGATIGNAVANGAGAHEAKCRSGTLLPEAEVLKAKASAQATMRTYFAIAGASETADVSAAFKRGRGGLWISFEGAARAKAVDDATARRFHAAGGAVPEPLGFVRSGDGQSARGVWLLTVASPAGPQSLAAYVGDFQPRDGQWKLTTLRRAAPAKAPPVVQYCHGRGDVAS